MKQSDASKVETSKPLADAHRWKLGRAESLW